MWKRKSSGLGAAACAAALAVSIASANADPADFYRNKTVEILVGFSAGGGYDAYSRALARSIGGFIPGNPQVIVRNMTGAGSLRLARYLQDAAPRDGLSFGTIDNGLLIAALTKGNADFNASKLSWVGSIATDTQICLTWHASRAKTVDDLRKGETVFGATGRDDIRFVSTDAFRKVTGAKIKIVTGYPGTTDIRLAIENGELDGVCESWSSLKATKADWITGHKVNILVQFGAERLHELADVPVITEFARSPTEAEALKLIFSPAEAGRPFGSERLHELADVPVITEFARSPTEADALKLIFSPAEAGRPFGAPPDIPADRLSALRSAFDASMTDPVFQALAAQEKLEVDPTSGEDVERYLKKAYASPPAVIDLARHILE